MRHIISYNELNESKDTEILLLASFKKEIHMRFNAQTFFKEIVSWRDKFDKEKSLNAINKINTLLDIDEILVTFKNHVLSKSNTIVQTIKTGNGTWELLTELYNFLLTLIKTKLNSISWVAKKALWALAPPKAEFHDKIGKHLYNAAKANFMFSYMFQLSNIIEDYGYKNNIPEVNDLFGKGAPGDKWDTVYRKWFQHNFKTTPSVIEKLLMNLLYD